MVQSIPPLLYCTMTISVSSPGWGIIFFPSSVMWDTSSVRKALLNVAWELNPFKPRQLGAAHAPPYSHELCVTHRLQVKGGAISIDRSMMTPSGWGFQARAKCVEETSGAHKRLKVSISGAGTVLRLRRDPRPQWPSDHG